MSKKYTVDVLGVRYKVIYRTRLEDPKFLDELCDGYCDSTTKEIVIRSDIPQTLDTIGNLDFYYSKVLRHELVHAFLDESGLAESSWGGNEEIVDWIARQFNKIRDAIDWIELMKD